MDSGDKPNPEKIFIRTAYNYDRNHASDQAGLSCPEPTRTKQSFKEECDINTIVRRFGVTGELPTAVRMPTYGDFEGINDFHTAVNVVAQANEAFDAMPAAVRKRFDHDPEKFLDFFEKEENRAEGLKLGLVLPKAAELAATAPATAKAAGEAAKAPVGEKQGGTGGAPKGDNASGVT